MTTGVLGAVAEFERALLIERTQAGLARAKSEGKALGRPSALTEAQQADARQKLAAGIIDCATSARLQHDSPDNHARAPENDRVIVSLNFCWRSPR